MDSKLKQVSTKNEKMNGNFDVMNYPLTYEESELMGKVFYDHLQKVKNKKLQFNSYKENQELSNFFLEMVIKYENRSLEEIHERLVLDGLYYTNDPSIIVDGIGYMYLSLKMSGYYPDYSGTYLEDLIIKRIQKEWELEKQVQ